MPFENTLEKGENIGKEHFILLTLSQTTNFRLFQLKESADGNFHFDENGRKFSKGLKILLEKEKLLVTSNFSFSHRIFKRLGTTGK